MSSLVLILLLLPIFGAISAFLLGKIDKRFAFWTAWSVGLALFLISLRLFMTFTTPIDIPMTWFSFGAFSIPFGIYIDTLSLVMLLIATGLGFLDLHFSHDYMKDEKDQSRYYAKMLFFIGGMILLVSAKDLISLFVGWEFMGLASYLLISFWHNKKEASDAGVSAFLITRFGDIFLFSAIGMLFYLTNTLDLMQINHLAKEGQIGANLNYLIAIFIFIAAIGKSGQFPLFPWLLRAMQGPTTVSALIHGATMVNSGIYIVARLFDFYVVSETLIIVASFGAISAFIGATSALVQKELKKVLAYSTMSHLSLAFVGLGSGSLTIGMSHLVNHSVFKALLFLSAGAIIMSASHIKELWRFGGFSKKMPLVALFMGIGALSLSGIPPFSGFYSKDAIIALTFLNPQTNGIISTLTLIAGVLSIAYISRVYFLVFIGQNRDEELFNKVTTPSFFWISLPLGVMAIVTLILGFYQEELALFISSTPSIEADIEGLFIGLLGAILFLGLLVYYYYVRRLDITKKIASQPLMKAIHTVLFNGYFIEFFIHYFVKHIVLESWVKTINWIEINIIDRAINAIVLATQKIHQIFNKTHSGYTSGNSGLMLGGIVLLLIIFLIGGTV